VSIGLNRVELAGDPGATALKVDGKVLPFDAATLAVDPGSIPVLTVSLPVAGGVVVTLDARIRLAPDTHAALVAMGWTPPAEPGESPEDAAPRELLRRLFMEPSRTVTFAGFLHPDDYAIAGDLVTIDCQRGAACRSQRTAELRAAVEAMGAELLPSGLPGGHATRTARPFVTVTTGLGPDAGRSIEDIGRDFAARQAPALAARVPGDALEAWLLPVTDFSLPWLIIPAGDWPPGPYGPIPPVPVDPDAPRPEPRRYQYPAGGCLDPGPGS
jgi:hypothetical protein